MNENGTTKEVESCSETRSLSLYCLGWPQICRFGGTLGFSVSVTNKRVKEVNLLKVTFSSVLSSPNFH